MNLHSSLNVPAKEVAAEQVSALVSAACEGSSSAFGELHTLYRRRVFKTIIRITKNKEDAEDVLQDTFLRAFLSLRSFERRSSFYSWLIRIGINSALLVLRKRRSRSEVSLELTSDIAGQPRQFDLEDSGPDPEQICNQRQQCALILHSIQGLAPSLRAPIILQTVREHSLKDIARELEITEAAVKARLHRARARLNTRVIKGPEDLR
jgi:RNA polymerase sigma-70 factor (ECF subfamily)